MKNIPSISVLLSTYNGESYLREQLDSIFSQIDVEVHLVVRDDGSKDNTIEILKEYAEKYPYVTILEEENCGCEASFEKLNKYAFEHTNTSFYAYADQDDVWYSDKLSKSICSIRDKQLPALYCCNQMITDENLKPLRLMLDEKNYDRICEVQKINYFKNRHGCTMVWNHALMEILGKAKHDPIYTPIHDKWITLLARCSGDVIIGKEPLQEYRIHKDNASGYATGILNRISKGIKLYWMRDGYNMLYANDCINNVSLLNTNILGVQYVFWVRNYKLKLWSRLKVACSPQIWKESISEGCIHSMSVLWGKY